MADKEKITKELLPEDSAFIPEDVRDEQTGEMVDVETLKKRRKPFKQGPYQPVNDYEG